MLKNKTIYPLILIAATLVCYWSALTNGFVNWDDPQYVLENPLVLTLTGSNIVQMFTTSAVDNYHPLTLLSLAIEYALVGPNPFLFHLTNLLLHIFNVWLVFLFISRLTKGQKGMAFITALIFAIHPLHVESVAWISERKDVLYACFFLLALLQYLKYLNKQERKYYLGTLGFFVLSLLSKPAAVTLPLVLVLLDFYTRKEVKALKELSSLSKAKTPIKNKKRKTPVAKERKSSAGKEMKALGVLSPLRKLLIEKIPFFALSILFGLITFVIQSDTAVRTLEQISLLDRFFYGFYALMIYTTKFLLPFSLKPIYVYPAENAVPWFIYTMPLLAIILYGGTFYYFRKSKKVLFGLLFFLLTISITLQFLSFGAAVAAERYTYIPYIGLGFLVALLWQRFHKKHQWVNYFAIGMALMTGFLCWQQTKVWKDGESLWTQAIQNNSRQTALPYSNRASYYKSIGELQKAEADFAKAIELDPKDSISMVNLANMYYTSKRVKQAEQMYNQVLSYAPNNVDALLNRAVLRFQNGQQAAALQDINRAIAIKPNHPAALKTRGTIYYQMGNYQQALSDYTRYHPLAPADHAISNAIVSAYIQLQEFQKGILYANVAIQYAPNMGAYYYNRAVCYKYTGSREQAHRDARKAVSLGATVNPAFYE